MQKEIVLFIVDDDQNFINSIQDIDFADCQVFTFTKPHDAIKEIERNRPDIIVSDIMMPGMDGIAFQVVCEEFIKPKKFVVISANSLSDLEKIGLKSDAIFYRKPLGQKFYNEIELLIREVNQAKKDEVPSEPKVLDIERRFENLENLHSIWTEIQDKTFKFAVESKFSLGRSDEFYDWRESLLLRLQGARQALGLGEDRLNSIFSKFAEREVSASTKIEEEMRKTIKSEKTTVEYPFFFNIGSSAFKKYIEVENFEIRVDGNHFSTFANGIKIETPKYHSSLYFVDEKIVKSMAEVDRWKSLWSNYSYYKSIVRNSIFLLLRNKKISKLVFPEGISIGGQLLFSCSSIEKDLYTKSLVFYDKLGALALGDSSDFSWPPPDKINIVSERTVEVTGLLGSQPLLFVDGHSYKVPIEVLIQDMKHRGFERTSFYDLYEASMKFFYDIAEGKTDWHLCGRWYSYGQLLDKKAA